MHRLLFEVLDSHPRYQKIASTVRSAFAAEARDTKAKTTLREAIQRVKALPTPGATKATRDTLVHHFLGAAKFAMYERSTAAMREELQPHIPKPNFTIKGRTLQAWERFEQRIREKVLKGNVGVLLEKLLADINDGLGDAAR